MVNSIFLLLCSSLRDREMAIPLPSLRSKKDSPNNKKKREGSPPPFYYSSLRGWRDGHLHAFLLESSQGMSWNEREPAAL